jgi:hypothetical protein
VANYHLVVAYDERATEWLAEQGYPHPPARPGNRLPTFDEIEETVRFLGIGPGAPLIVDGVGVGDSFTIRGDLLLELRVLRKLCERCGQLWVYPDCGSPAIVVDAALSPEVVAEIWEKSNAADDSWKTFHERVYGS